MSSQNINTLKEINLRQQDSINLQENLLEHEESDFSQKNSISVPESTISEVNINKHNLMGKFPGVWSHTKTLLWKNYLIQRRNIKSLLFLLLGPFLVCGIIIAFQYLADDNTQREGKDPPIHAMGGIPECALYSQDPDNCYTFGYGVIGDRSSSPWIDYAINFISQVNKLNRTKEFHEVLSAKDGTEYNKKYIDYFNKTENWGFFNYGLIFCADSYMDIPRGNSGEMVRVDCRKANFNMNGDITYNNGIPIETLQKSYFYTIIYNNTWEYAEVAGDSVSSFSLERDNYFLTLKVLIDSAIINYEQALTETGKPPMDFISDFDTLIQNNSTSFVNDAPNQNSAEDMDDKLQKMIRFNITHQNYAFPASRFYNGFNIINQIGAFYYFLLPMYLFVQIQGEIVMEKQRRLRAGLNIQGVSHTAFYLSWFLTSVIYSVAISILQIVASLIFQFEFFLDTPFLILFFLFFLFTLSMQFFGYFIATVMPNTNQSYSFSYGFVLFAVVIELFLSKPDAIIPYLYNIDRPAWIMIFVIALNLYSPFQYTLIFVAISMKAGIHFDDETSNWTRGTGYEWSYLTDTIKGSIRGITYEAPCPLQSFLLLIVTMVLYSMLTWYFDHVVASNRGCSQPWYFLFTPTYWKGVFSIQSKKKPSQSYLLGLNQSEKQEEIERPPLYIQKSDSVMSKSQQERMSTVQEEEERIKQRFYKDDRCDGVRIFDVRKNFIEKKSIFKKPTVVQAVRGVTLEIQKNEILGLLGHNGAGKTTLLSILCGLLKQTSGSVTICNYSTSDEIDKIRQLIGICPQFDILWDDLTGLEHLELFAKIKGMNPKYIKQIGHQMLEMVQLNHVANAYSRTYSGGMKRRLSLAICGQGNPKVILLDEPTTGMDPKSKKEVWNLIQSIRKDKSIILTTHAMEEADVLSDRIAIMVSGQIKCIGTSLKLKDIYGGGYRMQLIVKNPEFNCEQVQQFFKKHFPQIKLLKESSGSMLFAIPNKKIVKKLFEMFEQFETPIKDKLLHQDQFIDSYTKPNTRLMTEKSRVSDLDFSIQQQYTRNSYRFFELIEDWGISDPTIEDVFIQVTEEEEQMEEQNKKNKIES